MSRIHISQMSSSQVRKLQERLSKILLPKKFFHFTPHAKERMEKENITFYQAYTTVDPMFIKEYIFDKDSPKERQERILFKSPGRLFNGKRVIVIVSLNDRAVVTTYEAHIKGLKLENYSENLRVQNKGS